MFYGFFSGMGSLWIERIFLFFSSRFGLLMANEMETCGKHMWGNSQDFAFNVLFYGMLALKWIDFFKFVHECKGSSD